MKYIAINRLNVVAGETCKQNAGILKLVSKYNPEPALLLGGWGGEETFHVITLHSWVLVAQVCNYSYSGGRDQETEVQSQPGETVRETLSPYVKNNQHKKRLAEWLKW
jgi:hypothetical protein